ARAPMLIIYTASSIQVQGDFASNVGYRPIGRWFKICGGGLVRAMEHRRCDIFVEGPGIVLPFSSGATQVSARREFWGKGGVFGSESVAPLENGGIFGWAGSIKMSHLRCSG